MKKLFFFAAILAGLFSIISGCSKTATPGSNAVWMQNMAFVPSSITIPVNGIVTWTNKDAVTHNVTSDSAWFASGNIAPNGVFSRQFTTAGTFNYSCTIHANMRGTVIVH